MIPLRNLHWKHYLTYGILSAACYCITVAFFCRDATFTDTWLLFTGNLIFLIVVAASLFSFNNQRKNNASTVSMLSAGNITTITGIIISCVVCMLLLIIYIPGVFHAVPGKTLQDEPANTIQGKTNGMVFMIFIDAVFGNFASGFAASIIFSFILKTNQTGENVPPAQSEL
ncbi:MAG: hypothetical protein QM764_09380 [Chitinophagaceae bacterium]